MSSFDSEDPQHHPHWQPQKPDVVPSNDVYITPTVHPRGVTRGVSMEDFWTKEGLRVRELLAELYNKPESRIDMATTDDEDARYDFILVPPRVENAEQMRSLMQQGIAKHFGLQIEREARPMDVFVMTAPNGITGVRDDTGGGGFNVVTMDLVVPEGFEQRPEEDQRAFFEQHMRDRMKAFEGRAPGGARPTASVSASGACTPDHLCRILEGMLDRLVVDETNTVAGFELAINAENGAEGFIDALREQLGIVVTPDRRDVEMIVVRARRPT